MKRLLLFKRIAIIATMFMLAVCLSCVFAYGETEDQINSDIEKGDNIGIVASNETESDLSVDETNEDGYSDNAGDLLSDYDAEGDGSGDNDTLNTDNDSEAGTTGSDSGNTGELNDEQPANENEETEEEPVETGIVLGEDGKFYENGVLMEFCWIEYEGKRYFARPGGELYKNQFICLYGKDYYYMGADGSVQPGAIETPDGRLMFYEENGEITGRTAWIDYDGKRYFAKAGGELYKNQFICLYGSDYYYMGADGSVQTGIVNVGSNKLYYAAEDGLVNKDTGWVEYNGKKYFARKGGELYKNQLICLYGKDYYYMGADGSVQTGVIKTADNKQYFADEDGLIKTEIGWIEQDGKRYFARSDGQLYKNQLICLYGKDYYYMGADGSVQKGMIRTADNKLYFADDDGLIRTETGWIDYNGKRYFARSGGELYKNQFICLYGKDYYYMGSDGSVQSGVIKTPAGKVVFVEENGQMTDKTGWLDYNGKKYFIKGDGVLYSNQFICLYGKDYYYMGSDGSVQKGIVRTADNKLYYADEDGLVKKDTGWVEYNGKKYFARSGGELYKNQFIALYGKDYYYMGSDGSVQKGIINASDGKLYYADENGLVKKTSGWIDYNGKRYFARSGGALYRNQFICILNTDYYYMGSDGSVTKEPVVVNGYKIYPDKTTGKVSKLDYEFTQSDYIYNGYVTYIKVNVSSQELRFVKNGRLVLYAPIVTGKSGFDTPKGSYYINNMARNVRLMGQAGDEDWDVTVSYWMAFIGGSYGIHDADWQVYNAGDRYKTYGSHGCVNMRPSDAAKLYSEVWVGVKVFIV